MLSKHALIRSQQRGIPALLIDLLLALGACEPIGAGVEKRFFDKAARRRVRTYAGPLAQHLEEHLDVYAVVDSSRDVVVTVCRAERIRRN